MPSHEVPRGPKGDRSQRAELLSSLGYDVRPHACAPIFHASPCFENV